jgi:hypothetical protein
MILYPNRAFRSGQGLQRNPRRNKAGNIAAGLLRSAIHIARRLAALSNFLACRPLSDRLFPRNRKLLILSEKELNITIMYHF